ncbi:MAG: hypothetical protein KA746_16675 [Pyrinomonadaceae bacterium]|nr:hypothetical protein [Pyrinomonadaceae bacterium]MBP6214517.1 hypothetical protein [Pyrinomonadaceae bacterium]
MPRVGFCLKKFPPEVLSVDSTVADATTDIYHAFPWVITHGYIHTAADPAF